MPLSPLFAPESSHGLHGRRRPRRDQGRRRVFRPTPCRPSGRPGPPCDRPRPAARGLASPGRRAAPRWPGGAPLRPV